MEGLGVAASIIAVVNLSVKVASLCFRYGKDVKNARADIDRLHTEVTNVQDASESVRKLLNGLNGTDLEASQKLQDAVKSGIAQLETLEQRLKLKTSHKAMRRMGLRGLKWPFQRGEVEETIQNLRQCTQAISLVLQVDQT